MNELITREQFDAEAMAHAEKMLTERGIATMKTLLTDPRCGGYDMMPPHLKADMHKLLGVEPVQMFRRTSTSTGEPHGWQPIETAPKVGTILGYGKQKFMETIFWSPGMWTSDGETEFKATHWMPLPEPPEGV